MNILVVDDKKLVRESLLNTLTPLGHHVECAVNGLDALEKIKNNDYHLCIVDHLMPLMNGAQLTKNLQQNELYKNIPILFMTTQDIKAVKLLAEYRFFSAVMSKPIDKPELLMLISQLTATDLSNTVIAINE